MATCAPIPTPAAPRAGVTVSRATSSTAPSAVSQSTSCTCLGQKKLIVSFSGHFSQKLMRQGGFIFYFSLLHIIMRVFNFFLPRCDVAFFITISLFFPYVCG